MWDEMTPAQRDQLVAERVAGWHPTIDGTWYQNIDGEGDTIEALPLYSQDISTAFTLLDNVSIYRILRFPGEMVCGVWPTQSDYNCSVFRPKAEGIADTLPAAICKAFLILHGVEI